jgi:hypothetical protein
MNSIKLPGQREPTTDKSWNVHNREINFIGTLYCDSEGSFA